MTDRSAGLGIVAGGRRAQLRLARLRIATAVAAAVAIAAGTPSELRAEEESPVAAAETATSTTTPAETEKPAAKQPKSLHLIARERLVARTADDAEGGEADTDGQIYLAASATSASGALVGDLALSIWSDLDGISDGEPTLFASSYDPARGTTFVEVLSLWVGYEGDGLIEEARAGRQVVEHGTPTSIDGLSLTLDIYDPWVEVFLFGGRTVHFFALEDESYYEDWVASAGVTLRPAADLKIEADYRFQREDNAEHEELIDNSYGFAAWYRPADWLQVKAYLRGVDDDLSRVGAATRLAWPGLDVGVETKLYAQPMQLDELNVRDDPYFLTLGQSDPFLRWRVDAWAGVETSLGTFALHLGGDGRHLLDSEPSPFNRNLGRLFVLGTAENLFVKGVALTLTLERHSEEFDFDGHGVWAVAGSLGYESENWQVTAGSSYDQYKYTYYQSVDELEDVRTFFLDARVQLTRWLKARARYQLELMAWTSHTITITLSQEY